MPTLRSLARGRGGFRVMYPCGSPVFQGQKPGENPGGALNAANLAPKTASLQRGFQPGALFVQVAPLGVGAAFVVETDFPGHRRDSVQRDGG